MNVGFIGAGHIARALAVGWSSCPAVDSPRLLLYDVVAEQAERVAAAGHGRAVGSLEELAAASDLLVVAVRPGDVEEILRAVAPVLGDRPVVSLAAGVTLDRLRAALPDGACVGRIMPNIAAEMGLGVFLFAAGSLGARADKVRAVFDLVGTTIDVTEPLFDVGTSVSGCMPGFMAYLVEAFAAAGRQGGLDGETARRLAVAAAHGAAALVARSGDPAAVIEATATPGGMTRAGLDALAAGGTAARIQAAVETATARAKELAP